MRWLIPDSNTASDGIRGSSSHSLSLSSYSPLDIHVNNTAADGRMKFSSTPSWSDLARLPSISCASASARVHFEHGRREVFSRSGYKNIYYVVKI